MPDEESRRYELYRIRARSYAFTGVRLFGLGLILFGAYAMFAPPLIEYYRQQGGVPDLVAQVNGTIPELDYVTSAVVIGAGLVILHLSTR